jgi:hypothetical protein
LDEETAEKKEKNLRHIIEGEGTRPKSIISRMASTILR